MATESPCTRVPLPLATPGQTWRVVGFAPGRDVEQRLAGQGLIPGCELQVLQSDGGNLVLALGNTRLALGLGLAQKVLLAPAGEPA